MNDALLRNFSLNIAVLGGLIAVASLVISPLTAALLPATIIVAAFAAVLFCSVVFSRFYRRGVEKINRDMQGNDAWPGKPKRFTDKAWGVFGSKWGTPSLLVVRAVLLMGLLPIGLLSNYVGTEVVLLWFASAFVAGVLSIMHAVQDAHMRID